MLLECLNHTKGPAEALFLESIKVKRHETGPIIPMIIYPTPTTPQQPHRKLHILSNTLFVPSPDLFQCASTNQAHTPETHYAIHLSAAGHRNREEPLIHIIEPFKIGVTLPLAIMLWSLYIGNTWINEMATGCTQKVWLNQIVSIYYCNGFHPGGEPS